jgi:hypothetical protein
LNQNLADSGIPLRFIPKAGRSNGELAERIEREGDWIADPFRPWRDVDAGLAVEGHGIKTGEAPQFP